MKINNLPAQTDTVESDWTNVNGLRIQFFAARNPAHAEKTPIVLIHGLAISNRYLVPAIGELARHRPVFAPNLPGSGESAKPKRALNIAELADALADWMKAVGIRRAVLIGHSLGSQIVAEFAANQKEMVEKLILAAPTFETGKRGALRQFWRLLIDAPREPFSLIRIAISDYLKFGIRRGISTIKYGLRDKIEDKLPRIKAPTLILRGELDAVMSKSWVEEMAELLPNGKSLTISGGTHGVVYQSHKQFAEAVLKFIQKQI